MKILIVGYGSIGKRHVQNLLKIPNIDIIVCTSITKNLQKNKKCKFFHTIRESLKEKPDAAIICSVTSEHIKDSIILAKSGIHLMIEKPLSHTSTNTKNLLKITENKNLITLIGCNLRFHPCIKKIKELLKQKSVGNVFFVQAEHGSYLPDWHPGEKYRNSYAANSSLGGGVLLSSIHEIDYLYWFFGMAKEVFSFSEKLGTLKISADDFSSLLLRFKNKVVAEIHLDFLQKPTSRSCKIIGSKGIIQWDYNGQSLKLFNYKNNTWKTVMNLKQFDLNQTYIDELIYFIKYVKNKKKTLNPLSDGIETLKIALNAKKSSKMKKVVMFND